MSAETQKDLSVTVPSSSNNMQNPNISENQSTNDANSPGSTAIAPEVPPQNWAVCDSCDERISPALGPRYKCQNCPDFDYCVKCYIDASLIHPGHTFEAINIGNSQAVSDADTPGLQSRDDAAEPDGTNTERVISQGPKVPECRSCKLVTTAPRSLHLALKDLQLQGHKKQQTLSLRWPIRLSGLIEATQRGCAFCAFILKQFFDAIAFATWNYKPKKPWYADPSRHEEKRLRVVNHAMTSLAKLKSDRFVVFVTPSGAKRGLELPDFDKLEISMDKKSVEAHGLGEVQKANIFQPGVLTKNVTIFSTRDDPSSEHITARTPNALPASEPGMEQARKWLKTCEEEHGNSCNLSQGKHLPPRVIDVSAGDMLRLHASADEEVGKYCTLSYCSGGSETFQTTGETLEERKTGFPLADLPQTLQDAVRVTQNLGVRYLWVDSLCILQDSEVDKAEHLSHMSEIYKHSHVTISAGRASSAAEGFLSSWADAETGLWPSLIPLAYCIPSKAAKSLQEASQLPKHAMGKIWLMEEEIYFARGWDDSVTKKAWSLQELILSPRVLYFGRWPTWRCNKVTDSDGGFTTAWETEDNKLTDILFHLSPEKADFLRFNQLYEHWCSLLNRYTKREVNVDSDRLPTFSAIAQNISRITGVYFLAGLRGNNLLRDLMWYADGREWLLRPEKWRAPTWSWASINLPITYTKITSDAKPVAQVLSCNVTTAPGSSPDGEVQGGTLEICGPLSQVRCEDVLHLFKQQNLSQAPPKSNIAMDWYAQCLAIVENRPRHGQGNDEVEASLPSKVFAMITFTRDWLERFEEKVMIRCYSGLLLHHVENDRYERIGSFCNEDLDWVDQRSHAWAEQTITIV